MFASCISQLFQFDVLDGGLVVDMFCGSGSVGLEALSRGMDRAVFVDFSPVCTEAVLENVNHCGFENRGEAVCTRVEEVWLQVQSVRGRWTRALTWDVDGAFSGFLGSKEA